VSLTIYPPPSDVISIEDFDGTHLNQDEPSLYYSACRDVIITLTANPANPLATGAAPTPGAIMGASTAPGTGSATAIPPQFMPIVTPPPPPPTARAGQNAKRPDSHALTVIPPIGIIPPMAGNAGGTVLKTTLRVADPGYLEAIALPAKGTVSLRNDCGAEVSSQPTTASSGADIAAEIARQAKAAWKK
jgi:hypothetical protein